MSHWDGGYLRDSTTGALVTTAGTSSPLEGVPAWLYSHSFGNIQSPINCSPGSLYADRIVKRLNLSSLTKRANDGYYAQDIASIATQGAQAWTPGTTGVVLLDSSQNDMSNNGTSANGIDGFTESLKYLIWLFLSGSRTDDAAGAFTYPTGTWTAATGTATTAGIASAGTIHFSTSTGAASSLAFTGTDLVLVFNAKAVGAAGAAGGTVQVQVDGVTAATVSLSRGTTSVTTTMPFVPIAVPLLGLSNTAHTITMTNTGAAATAIWVDSYLVPSATPPTVGVLKQLFLQPYALSGSDAAVTAYNAAFDTVVSYFQGLGKPVSSLDVNTGFDKTTMFSSAKPRHPNDSGMRFYNDLIARWAQGLAYRSGLNAGW